MEILIVVIVAGILMAAFRMDERAKNLAYAIMLVLVLIWALAMFGIVSLPHFAVFHVN